MNSTRTQAAAGLGATVGRPGESSGPANTPAPDYVPRKVLVSAWAVALMVIGQFSFFAAIPVVIVVTTVLRRSRVGALRWWALGLGAAYATPVGIWILRPDRAGSLSKDMSPVFLVLIVAAACGVIVAAHRARRQLVEPHQRSCTASRKRAS